MDRICSAPSAKVGPELPPWPRLALCWLCFAWSSSPAAEATLLGPIYTLANAAEICVEPPVPGTPRTSRCKVSSFKRFGSHEGLDYFRAHYCLEPVGSEHVGYRGCGEGSYAVPGQAIFAGRSGEDEVHLLMLDTPDDFDPGYYFGEPAIISNHFGHWLHLNCRIDGTGHGNASRYYLWARNGWQQIDHEGWLNDLYQQLASPSAGMEHELEPGLKIWKGIWPELSSMTAKVALYRQRDANCCPSGGFLDISLGLESGRLVLESIKHHPAAD